MTISKIKFESFLITFVDPWGSKMSSTVDSGLNLVETDSCPNFSRSAVDACSLDCLPSASWEMDSNANFSWNWSDSHKRQKEEKVKTKHVTLPVKNIPPPKLGITCSWKYPEYVNFTERFATFNEWPKFLKGPSKRDLARAGFIYTQIGDKVTCFSCGMTLKNWEPLDDAYNEHLRWAKCCPYAKMVTDGKLLRG